jgi:hypothetical protein
MTPASDAPRHRTVDLCATRRQFLFAREQVAAHQPHAQRASVRHRPSASRPPQGARAAEGWAP